MREYFVYFPFFILHDWGKRSAEARSSHCAVLPKIYSQDMGNKMILVDRETGVNYLFVASGYAGGLTPLLDREGKPVVSPLPVCE